MAWPNRNDYFLAIQNPSLVFSDPELKAGKPKLTPHGMPWGFNGAFASVYEIECGKRQWAVKCFLNEYADQQERYAAISSHLNFTQLPYAVGFEYQPHSLLVNGRKYPILKMEWIKGERLDNYIKSNINNPSVLLNLAEQWALMNATLGRHSIAHGDLQHGNVFIVGGQLKLIDYDGMFVPSLSGKESRELGHKNYQHPCRKAADFGPHLDNFSAWVVYLAILALAADSALWKSIQDAGDDRILFSKEDFDSPDFSQVFLELSRLSGHNVSAFASAFKNFSRSQDLRQIPPLAEFASVIGPVIAQSPTSIDWLKDHRGTKPPTPSVSQPAPAARPADGSWLETHLPSLPSIPSVRFKPPALVFTMATYSILLGCAALFRVGSLDLSTIIRVVGGGLLIILMWTVLLWRRFKKAPEVKLRTDAMANASELELRISDETAKLKDLITLQSEANALEQAEFLKLQARYKACEANERDEISRLSANAAIEAKQNSLERQKLLLEERTALELCQRQINQVKQKENDDLCGLFRRRDQELNQLATQRQATLMDEQDEIKRELTSIQATFLKEKLGWFLIERASIPGIGPATISTLLASGIKTAADLPDQSHQLFRISSINRPRRNALVEWKKSIAAKFQREMPSALLALEESRIKRKYDEMRTKIDERITHAKNTANRDENFIKGHARVQIQQTERQLDQVKSNFQTKRQAIMNRENEVVQRLERDRNSVANRWHTEKKRLEGESQGLERKYAPQRTTTDAEIAKVQQRLTDTQWERRKVDRELKSFQNLTFANYIIVLLFRGIVRN